MQCADSTYVQATGWRLHSCSDINLQDLVETAGPQVDGIAFSGGCEMALQRDALQQMTRISRDTGMSVCESGLLEHALAQVPSATMMFIYTVCS